jgi:hypothetical protein
MSSFKYNCNNCAIHTNLTQTYSRHLQSKRHKQQIDSDQFIYACEKCNKKFKCNSGRWRHSKKCKKQPEINVEELTEKVDKITDLLVDIKTNQQPTTAITQNNQNHNNFNVNLFLNENCTNAKNFIDMINGIQLDTEYHEYISSADYVDSIVRLIKSELDKLPIIERPIHCIKNEDENQQILHIRHNNTWSKETELEWTQQIHNYYIDDEDEPADENKKIIFYAIKQMEDNIIEQIQKLYEHTGKLGSTKREYKCEMNYVPNKMRIIKCLIEHVNMDKNELKNLIEEAYKQLRKQIEQK